MRIMLMKDGNIFESLFPSCNSMGIYHISGGAGVQAIACIPFSSEKWIWWPRAIFGDLILNWSNISR